MATHTHTSSRRRFLTVGATALATIPARARADARHPDAALIALGVRMDRETAALAPLARASCDLDDVFAELEEGLGVPRGSPAWWEARRACGFETAAERFNAQTAAIDTITREIRETPAATFAGLAVKMNAARFDCFFGALFARGIETPECDLDWSPECFEQLRREVERLACNNGEA